MIPVWDESSQSGDSEASQDAMLPQNPPDTRFFANTQLPPMNSSSMDSYIPGRGSEQHSSEVWHTNEPVLPSVSVRVSSDFDHPNGQSEVDYESSFQAKPNPYHDVYSHVVGYPQAAPPMHMGGNKGHYFAPASQVCSTSSPVVRCPSPSDAVIPVTCGRSSVASGPSSTAASLGQKSGKPEFFAAREDNKLLPKLFSERSFFPPETPQRTFLPPPPTPVMPLAVPAVAGPSLTSSFVDGPADNWAPGPSEDIVKCKPRPIPVSHAASRRTHVGISDIVENCQPISEKVKGKRKAEEISNVTAEEVHWDTNPETVHSPSSSHSDLSVDTAATSVDNGSAVCAPVAMNKDIAVVRSSVEEVPARPLKRVCLRVAERLGYAAIGGLTGAAVVVSSLIYTAPTFS
jgi:hypothetical protein